MASVLIGDTRHGLTPWLSTVNPPAHVGVYELDEPPGSYACWNGDTWHEVAGDPAAAAISQTVSSLPPVCRWRGLTEPADAPCSSCGGHTLIDAGVTAEGDDLISECPDC